MTNNLQDGNKNLLVYTDQDPTHFSNLLSSLNRTGYSLSFSYNLAHLELTVSHGLAVDLVILDFKSTSKELSRLIEKLDLLNIPYLLTSPYLHSDFFNKISKSKIMNYLVYPIEEQQLLITVEFALHHSMELKKLRDLSTQLECALRLERNVNVAVGVLMAKEKISKSLAIARLKTEARNKRMKLENIADQVLESIAQGD